MGLFEIHNFDNWPSRTESLRVCNNYYNTEESIAFLFSHQTDCYLLSGEPTSTLLASVCILIG